MRNLTKALTVVSLLAPVSGHSLGIGDIRVRSALNQNLSAEISLVASHGESPSNIKVSLASPEKFDKAGVPWSYFLSKIKFQPIVKPNGSMVIKVSSREALKEPYLNFLLEVSWPKGNLYREFTVLVDPPAEYQSPTAYQEPAYPLYENTLPQQQEYTPPRQRRVRQSAKPRCSSAGSYGEQITTRRNDTLWNVAERACGAGVSVEQMTIALYEKNPHAFFQQNVNALSAGKTLKIPDKDAVQQPSRQEALAEFGRQNAAWNNNRSSIPAGEAQLAKGDEADSQLKLVAPAEATVGQNEAVSPSSEQASGNSNMATPVDEALQSKMAALEKQMAMMQELIALKDKQLADLQNLGQATAPATPTPPAQIAPPPVPAEQVKPEPIAPVAPVPPVQTAPIPVKPVQPVAPVKPIVKPVVKPPVQAAEPVAEETDSSLLWIIGGIGATVLSLFGWLWWRKRKIIEDTGAESMRNSDSTGLFSSAARKKIPGTVSGESSFLNDFKASYFESFESFNVDHGDIDPVAEADVYLAYGRYQQAEDLISRAIKDFPDRDECKLKLFEIFHASTNKEAFESYATELAAEGKKDDKEFWRKVVELSKDVCPDPEMFASSGNAAVFATESLADNALFSPFDDLSSELGAIQGSEHLGAATFEVTEIESEQSHIFDEISKEPSVQHQAEPVAEVAEVPQQESDAELGLFENGLAGQQDNETIDFDLGPYPEATQKTETVTSPSLDTHTFSSDTSTQLEDSGDNAEVESYEFDFNMDKPEPTKPVKPEPPQDKETWNANQTIDFAIDDVASTDTFGDDTIDFSFDLELAQLDSDKQTSKDQGFMVSDLTDMDELETKLDLAKAYIDMGDADAAKEIIEQVLEHGSPEQKKTAQELMDELSLG